jgi:FixJ family two-component response regulator
MTESLQVICIIEDDESVRRALGRLIRSLGLDAQAFATAEEFLESIQYTLPSCLIVDVNLPGLNGLELQRRLQAEGRNIPVVVITAYANEEVREQAIKAGAIAFLSKPFEERTLLQAVSRVVNWF